MSIRVLEALYILATSHILSFWCSIPRVTAAFPIQISMFLQHYYFTSICRRNGELIVLPQHSILGVCYLHRDWRCPWNQRLECQYLALLSLGRIQDASGAIVNTNMCMNDRCSHIFIP